MAKTKRATMQDIAKRAGVSVSTVSYALSGTRPISAEVKQRIYDVARECDYPIPSSVFRRRSRTGIIAVSAPIHAYSSASGYSAFFFETLKAVRKHGYDLLLCASEADEVSRIAREHHADGLILLDVVQGDPRAASAENMAFPVVSVGVAGRSKKLYSVDLDFEKAAQHIVRRAVSAYKKSIMLVGAEEKAYEAGSNYLIRFRDALIAAAHKQSIDVNVVYSHSDPLETITMMNVALQEHAATDLVVVNSNVDTIPLIYDSVIARPCRIGMVAVGTYGSLQTDRYSIDEIPFEPSQACMKAMRVLDARIEGSMVGFGEVELIKPRYLDRGSF